MSILINVVYSLFVVAPIKCGFCVGFLFCVVVLRSNHLAGCFTLVVLCLPLPHGSAGWSAVCNCSITCPSDTIRGKEDTCKQFLIGRSTKFHQGVSLHIFVFIIFHRGLYKPPSEAIGQLLFWTIASQGDSYKYF